DLCRPAGPGRRPGGRRLHRPGDPGPLPRQRRAPPRLLADRPAPGQELTERFPNGSAARTGGSDMELTPAEREKLDDYRQMMGPQAGGLAVALDSLTDVMALLGQH